MKPCILLIEDDRDMRELVSGHLEHSGFDVQSADDGIKGQALALQYSPDLILLDLMLPKVDGLTLCQRLRRDERTAAIPILMLTALGGTNDDRRQKHVSFDSSSLMRSQTLGTIDEASFQRSVKEHFDHNSGFEHH